MIKYSLPVRVEVDDIEGIYSLTKCICGAEFKWGTLLFGYGISKNDDVVFCPSCGRKLKLNIEIAITEIE